MKAFSSDEDGRNAVALLTASSNQDWTALVELLEEFDKDQLAGISLALAAYVAETVKALGISLEDVLQRLGRSLA